MASRRSWPVSCPLMRRCAPKDEPSSHGPSRADNGFLRGKILDGNEIMKTHKPPPLTCVTECRGILRTFGHTAHSDTPTNHAPLAGSEGAVKGVTDRVDGSHE